MKVVGALLMGEKNFSEQWIFLSRPIFLQLFQQITSYDNATTVTS